MSTRAYEPTLASISNISNKEKLSLAQQKELELAITPLLSHSEGAAAVVAAIQPIQWSRPVLRVVVNETTRHFKEAKTRNDDELQRKLGAILLEIALRDKVNSDARWMAVSSALRLKLAGSLDALKVSLQQLGTDATDKYLKYAFHNMTPDGGLPYLLEAIRLRSPTQTLVSVIEKIAPEIGRREQIASLTAEALRDAMLGMINKSATDMHGCDRAILFLSVNVANTHPQLKDALLRVRAELERSSWDTSDWRHHLLASLNRLFSKPALAPPETATETRGQDQSRAGESAESGNQAGSDLVSEATAKLDRATTATKKLLIDQGSRIERLRSDLRDRNDTIKTLKESLNQLELQLTQTEAQNKELEAKRAEVDEAVRQLQLENELISKRAAQDVARADMERDSALTTFKSTLWRELQPCLVEAQNESHLPEQLSEESRILLRRLRDIVYVLHKHGIS